MQTAVGAPLLYHLMQNNFYSRGFPSPSPVRLRSTTCGFAASRGFAAAPAALPALPARGPLFLRPARASLACAGLHIQGWRFSVVCKAMEERMAIWAVLCPVSVAL